MKIELINKFTKCFYFMKRNNENIYHITITNLKTTKCLAYRSIVRSKLITPIRNYCISRGIGFDGIIAIEYRGDLTKPLHRGYYTKPIDDLGTHAHLIISTKLDLEKIKEFRNKVFNSGENILIDDITKRNDIEYLLDYLMKQNQIITPDNFWFDLRTKNKKIMVKNEGLVFNKG